MGDRLRVVARAGIESIDRGQMEAALALGMSYRQGMRRIVLPQAIRNVLPPLGNEFVACLGDLVEVLDERPQAVAVSRDEDGFASGEIGGD